MYLKNVASPAETLEITGLGAFINTGAFFEIDPFSEEFWKTEVYDQVVQYVNDDDILVSLDGSTTVDKATSLAELSRRKTNFDNVGVASLNGQGGVVNITSTDTTVTVSASNGNVDLSSPGSSGPFYLSLHLFSRENNLSRDEGSSSFRILGVNVLNLDKLPTGFTAKLRAYGRVGNGTTTGEIKLFNAGTDQAIGSAITVNQTTDQWYELDITSAITGTGLLKIECYHREASGNGKVRTKKVVLEITKS